MITEKEIIDKYLGVPYLHKGRDIKGLDCWGLVIAVYKEVGVGVLDLDNYSKNWSFEGGNLFIENYYKEWQKHGSPVFLDVILFSNCKGVPYHAGIYLSRGKFIHGSKAGVVISRLDDDKFYSRIEGIYRYAEKIS